MFRDQFVAPLVDVVRFEKCLGVSHSEKWERRIKA